MMKVLRAALSAAILWAGAAPAIAGQYSDLWWNPQESGWGLNLVQQQDTAFVTLFVYDTDGRPTWYFAPAARITHIANTGPIFAGTFYRARGPWHGGRFDSGAVQAAPVGELSLEVLAKDRMRVHYTAENGVAVVKDVVRMTWDQPIVGAFYAGQFALRQVPAGGPPGGMRDYPGDVLVHFDAETGQGYMRVDDPLRRCEYRGPYQPTGKLIRFSGSYSCTAGDGAHGTFEVDDLEISANGLSGYLRTSSSDMRQYGRFAAVLR